MTMTKNAHGQRLDRDALILYGSETGNSQDAAEDLGRMAERLHFRTQVSEMDMMELTELLHHTIVIFVISTTGQGEVPRNARAFWRSLLRKRLPSGCLGHMEFTTLGLGDSSYPKYNLAARKLHNRLRQLGAKEVYPRGEADEQHPNGIDGIFLPWSVDLRKHLLTLHPLPSGVHPIPSDVFLPPAIHLEAAEHSSGEPDIHVRIEDDIRLPVCGQLPPNNPDSAPSPENPNLSAHRSYTNLINQSANMDFLLRDEQTEDRTAQPAEMLKDHTNGEVISDSSTTPASYLPIPGAMLVKMTENKRITPQDHWQDVRLLTFEVPSSIEFMPGDSITIYPKNFPGDVQHIIDRMGWGHIADNRLRFCGTGGNLISQLALLRWKSGLYPVDEEPTLRELLTHNLDINAIPKRSFIDNMVPFTDNLAERERLLEFSNPAHSDEFFDYATRPRRSILELLDDFPSFHLPYTEVVHFFPIIRGRQYSICRGSAFATPISSPGAQKVQLIIALVKYRTVIRKIRQGLCSRYIDTLPEGVSIKTTINRNRSFYPERVQDRHIPIITIATGTGIAPIRSLLWDRAERQLDFAEDTLDTDLELRAVHQVNLFETGLDPNSVPSPPLASHLNRLPGDQVLFFGNRNCDKDFFFKDEWQHTKSLKITVFTAFSRDQKEKRYVQDVIREQAYLVAWLIEIKGATVYVCGSSGRMPIAVRQALLDCLVRWGSTEALKGQRERCEVYLEDMEKKRRYIQETW